MLIRNIVKPDAYEILFSMDSSQLGLLPYKYKLSNDCYIVII